MNGDNSTGDGWDPSVSEEDFYVSGENSQFTIINGVYQPIISMTVCLLYPSALLLGLSEVTMLCDNFFMNGRVLVLSDCTSSLTALCVSKQRHGSKLLP